MTATKTVLWADDDADGLLSLLPELFKRRGMILHPVTSYDEAIQALAERHVGANNRYDGVLADVILPRRKQVGTLARDLGVTLAERAVKEFGIARVCFLSVVPAAEFERSIEALRNQFGSAPGFDAFDKTLILENDMLDEIARIMSSGAGEASR